MTDPDFDQFAHAVRESQYEAFLVLQLSARDWAEHLVRPKRGFDK